VKKLIEIKVENGGKIFFVVELLHIVETSNPSNNTCISISYQ
jgi:hypothetical protein